MALDGTAKAENVVRSVRKWANDQLGPTFRLATQGDLIDYGGSLALNDVGKREWLQLRLLGPARPGTLDGPWAPVSDGAGGLRRGREVLWLLSFNIFVRPAMQTVAHRLAQLRDAVLNAVRVGVTITVADYTAAGTPSLGGLFVQEIERDGPVTSPEVSERELEQHSILALARWVEVWT